MTTVILVGGTWGGNWMRPGAPFRQYLEDHAFRCIAFEGWTGDVDGINGFGKNGKHPQPTPSTPTPQPPSGLTEADVRRIVREELDGARIALKSK